jgi:hypothetical protein
VRQWTRRRMPWRRLAAPERRLVPQWRRAPVVEAAPVAVGSVLRRLRDRDVLPLERILPVRAIILAIALAHCIGPSPPALRPLLTTSSSLLRTAPSSTFPIPPSTPPLPPSAGSPLPWPSPCLRQSHRPAPARHSYTRRPSLTSRMAMQIAKPMAMKRIPKLHETFVARFLGFECFPCFLHALLHPDLVPFSSVGRLSVTSIPPRAHPSTGAYSSSVRSHVLRRPLKLHFPCPTVVCEVI